jgi:hypothetical protein
LTSESLGAIVVIVRFTHRKGERMTRKDYEAIAKDIKTTLETLEEGEHSAKRVLLIFLSNFTEYMKEDNPRFDMTKFVKACGYEVI